MDINLWVAFIAGLVSFLSPCVLPLVPAYIGYMGGRATHTAAIQANKPAQPRTLTNRLTTFSHGIVFVAAFAVVFAGFGLITTAFVQQIGGSNIALVKEILARAGGVLIIFFGLHFTGLLGRGITALLNRPAMMGSVALSLIVAASASALILWAFVDILVALPIATVLIIAMVLGGAFHNPQQFWTNALSRMQLILYADTRPQMTANRRQGYLGSAAMGVVFAAGWTPCIGPIYGSILTLAFTRADVSGAGVLLVAYSLGLGVPFLLAALLLDSATVLMRRLSRHIHKLELVSGAFLILIGVLVASGELQSLSTRFSGEFADFSYQLEACAESLSRGEIALGEFVGCVSEPTEIASLTIHPS